MKTEKSCGAVIFKENTVLLIKHNAGHWAFPKGHVEYAETEVDTAKREISEETGLKVKIDAGCRTVVTYSPYEGCTKDVVYFVATEPQGELKPQLEEVSEVKFVDIEKALDEITFQNDRDVFIRAKEYYLKKR